MTVIHWLIEPAISPLAYGVLWLIYGFSTYLNIRFAKQVRLEQLDNARLREKLSE